MPAYSADPKARFRCLKPVLVWPAEATVTAELVERHGGDLASLVADRSLAPWGDEHPKAPGDAGTPAPAAG